MEYASLLGRHGIVSSLLLGGLDPTFVWEAGSGDEGAAERAGRASRRVLGLLHSLGGEGDGEGGGADARGKIPLSVWSYVVRAVVEMRMNGLLDAPVRQEGIGSDRTCRSCDRKAVLVEFGPPCRHSFCEPCLWDHLVDALPVCADPRRNVVLCPICGAEFGGFRHLNKEATKQSGARDRTAAPSLAGGHAEEKKEEEVAESPTKGDVAPAELRERRRLESLAKFQRLPEDLARSSSKKKKKKDHDAIHATWEEALRPVVERRQTKTVRTERFFRAVSSSPPLVAAYLDAGVDVDGRNEYGQTPLYIACWKGSAAVARLLLEYGANPEIAANGGSTCWDVAASRGREDVLDLLDRHSGTERERSSRKVPPTVLDNDLNHIDPKVTVLIDSEADHPGAGACIVDGSLTEQQLRQLEELFQTFPAADEHGTSTDEYTFGWDEDQGISAKSACRPSRSYYCDAEGVVGEMLAGTLAAASEAITLTSHQKSIGPRPPSLFERMRFLHYERPGGVLPPHVDLCRVDDKGVRSTHTLILYLSDCDRGGGTALLRRLNCPEVLEVVSPKRGRALIFPHLCPHSGLEVESAPKLLLRGEVVMRRLSHPPKRS